MKKIGIIGVHSAGKTSLTYILSAHFKMKGVNVKMIHESVRENCPFPINADANQGTCLWNFHTQFLNELEAEAQGYQLAICDRSVLDTFVYYHAVNPKSKVTHSALQQAAEWLSSYNLLLRLEPSEDKELQDDGVRCTDREYLKLINQGFTNAIEEHGKHVADKILQVKSEDVFDSSRKEKLISVVESYMQ